MTLRKITFVLLTILSFSLIGFYYLLEHKINQPIALKENQLIVIEPGESIYSFSIKLEQLGWINKADWLKVFVKLNPKLSQLKAGTYQISPKDSVKSLLLIVTSGIEHQFSITFVEGTTFKEWLTALSSHDHIRHTIEPENIALVAKQLGINASNPEGWFFPDTYAYTNKTTDIEILKRAHLVMRDNLARLWQSRAQPLPYSNSYEALIMASIVEKESAQLSEKPLIASVFVNRLNKKMRLQTDPTIIYGLGDRYQGDITRKHLREKTAYNTYRIDRLPPTPIAMPGLKALEAVLAPATTNYLYFVSQGDGHHVFSTNLTDHNRAVARYQLGKQ